MFVHQGSYEQMSKNLCFTALCLGLKTLSYLFFVPKEIPSRIFGSHLSESYENLNIRGFYPDFGLCLVLILGIVIELVIVFVFGSGYIFGFVSVLVLGLVFVVVVVFFFVLVLAMALFGWK